MPPAAVQIRVEAAHGYAVVQAGARMTLPDLPGLRAAIEKALRDLGTALVDLTATRRPEPIMTAVFPAALGNCGGWPWAKLAIFGADAELADLLARTRVNQLVPVWPTEAQALAGIGHRPPWVRVAATLPYTPSAPAGGRATVERACLAWHVPAHVRDAAVLIASELVSNVVQHAGTGSVLSVDRGRRTLTVAVRDFAPDRPVRVLAADAGPPFGGLAVVAALGRHWGVRPYPDGKAVSVRLPIAPAR
ncbi:MAG: hypothetical protein V7603_102 [Micromonosporaceae bacterium]